MEAKWVGNEEISAALDVSTAACTYCGGPARVPEDVAGVVIDPAGRKTPVVVCPDCGDKFMADMLKSMPPD